MNKLTITIKDLSKGKKKAFSATIRELNNSIAMGANFKELFEGIQLTIDSAKKYGIGIFKKTKHKIIVEKRNYTAANVLSAKK